MVLTILISYLATLVQKMFLLNILYLKVLYDVDIVLRVPFARNVDVQVSLNWISIFFYRNQETMSLLESIVCQKWEQEQLFILISHVRFKPGGSLSDCSEMLLPLQMIYQNRMTQILKQTHWLQDCLCQIKSNCTIMLIRMNLGN